MLVPYPHIPRFNNCYFLRDKIMGLEETFIFHSVYSYHICLWIALIYFIEIDLHLYIFYFYTIYLEYSRYNFISILLYFLMEPLADTSNRLQYSTFFSSIMERVLAPCTIVRVKTAFPSFPCREI